VGLFLAPDLDASGGAAIYAIAAVVLSLAIPAAIGLLWRASDRARDKR
jgi:hypothetical protein